MRVLPDGRESVGGISTTAIVTIPRAILNPVAEGFPDPSARRGEDPQRLEAWRAAEAAGFVVAVVEGVVDGVVDSPLS